MTEKPLTIVKSSAGSGKTFAISRAYLTLIIQHDSPFHFGHILALTFTVKATAEMKERIIVYLSDLAHGTSKRKDTQFMLEALRQSTGLKDSEIKSRSKLLLEALLHNYDDFSIMTIDKFFHRLVRSFSSDLSLSNDFEVQIDQNQFIDAVIESVQSRIGADDNLQKALLDFADFQTSQNRSYAMDSQLRAVIRELISDHFFQDQGGRVEISDEDVKQARSRIIQKVREIEGKVKEAGLQSISLLKKEGVSMEDLKGKSRGIWGKLNKLCNPDLSSLNDKWDSYEKFIQEDSWKTVTNNDSVDLVQPQIVKLLEELRDVQPQFALAAFLKSIYPSLFAIGFIQKLLLIIEETKSDLNIQSLGDFNRILFSKLKEENAYFLFERLGNQYQHILIDEFQDTSVIQWNNLIPLVENSISEGHQSLIVGDGKQSIYRFRGGETAQFSKLPSIDHSSSVLFEESANIEQLEKNYRSSKNIVLFNNRFFSEFIENYSPDLKRIYDGLDQTPTSEESGKVIWKFTSEYANKSDRFPFLAKHISGKIDSGIRPNTITCLLFKNDDARELAQALNHLGVEVISDENLKVISHPAVKLLLASHKLISNTRDPFLLQHWLLRLHHVKQIDNYQALAIDIHKKRARYRDVIEKLKLKDPVWFNLNSSVFSQMLSIAKSLKYDLEDSMVQLFLDSCLEYDQQHYYKESFDSYLNRVSDDLNIEVPADSQAVQLMTIHKSKGLEFEHVIIDVPDVSKSRLTKDFSWVELKEEIGLDLAYIETRKLEGTRHSAIWEDEDESSNIDFVNSLYVAFTRAKTSLEIFSKPMVKQKSVQFIQDWNEWDDENSELVFK
ncbi:MAG: UvrD-helicase domain-containing protein [Flavobacteriales bacterium]|jgi:ATP-dependent exoDNAse (exonuclease V) beta subunit|nr:UvrD-helicase domain-containing protein [Flavobacteriales bacterium]MBT4704431.1 UvrD-helicase domain-containing protein [Flavobacteriales bacterium]MBT4931177.1 UvrD-helicase domain-containing protein [Flavobacteriales bacterium]MBT5132037.1 UvrD-helicase domain-containing protein [Flavobacteriales bacterium]MBT6382992.1 UvrD-helicase domain-containing protein [Flavobacteriales bacterium]